MQEWKIVRSERILDEKYMKVRKDVVELPDGKTLYDYFVLESPLFVVVVTMTSDGKVVIVREYKHGIEEVMLKYPAGCVDGGESIERAAARELKEETGYEADSLELLAVLSPDPSKSTARTHVFLVRDAKLVQAQQLEPTEQVEVVLLKPAEVLKKIKQGEIWETGSIAATFLAGRKLGWIKSLV